MTFCKHTIGFTNTSLIVSLFLHFIYNLIALKIAETRHGLGSRIAKNIATFLFFFRIIPFLVPFFLSFFFLFHVDDDDDDAEHQGNGQMNAGEEV